MGRPHRGTSKKTTTDDEPMVQCGSCDSWFYLEDSPFSSIEEAQGKSYTCKFCTKISALHALIAHQERKMSAESSLDIETLRTQGEKSEIEGKAEIQRLQQSLNAEREQRERLSEEVTALQAKIEEPGKREGTSLVQKCQRIEDTKEIKTTPERQETPPSQTRGSPTQNEDQENAEQSEETETSAGPWIKVGKKNIGKKTEGIQPNSTPSQPKG
ncbi:hypothetical protein HPB49_013895 [Dermacentor silvarum]|uniref:Uncharacterized protein n=1 Tax=Dermacentor silvarum TaxID=543639 RepID=A0ACB8DDP1_DERSI|nr:hypothetical protein HPB49_013895 [Dermacentor silvarum]